MSGSRERPVERADVMQDRVLQFADAVGAFVQYWGFKAVHGRIWTLLVLRREPMTQVEIAEMLGISRSLVSGSVAELVGFGLVRAVGTQRSAPYEASMNVWPVIAGVLRQREWMLLERARVALEGVLEEFDLQGESAAAHWDRRRMATLLQMIELAQAFLKSLISIRMPKAAKRVSSTLLQIANLFRRFS